MLQLAAIAVGVIAVVMGIMAIAKGEVQLSRVTKLRGGSAAAAGIITIGVGLAVIGFAIIGMPLLLGP